MLSCCHSFCTQCIQSLITEGAETNSLTCPSCQQTTSVPSGGVTSLPRNLHLINKQSDILSKVTSNPPPPCDSCGEDTSIAYCTKCPELLCNQCFIYHQGLRKTRNHLSFNLEEARQMNQDQLAAMLPSCPTSSTTCQEHAQSPLDLYCQQCNLPVCAMCLGHEDHPVVKVNEQVNESKEALYQSLEWFRKAQQQLKEVLTLGEQIKRKIKLCNNEVDTIIRQTFANLQQLLHQREETLLAQSSEIANPKEADLSLQLEGIQHLLEAITHCQRLTTTSIGEYNDVELLSVAHTLQTRVNQLQQQFSETSLELCESPTISVNINEHNTVTAIQTLGVVLNDKETADNITTMVWLPPHNVITIGKESKLKVISRDGKGKELSKGGATVSGSLTPFEEKGTTIQVKTTDCGDGTYIVSLKPQQLGQHNLSLVINHRYIHGNPFNLTVVASRDYTAIKNPIQTITGLNNPWFMAFSSNGDMFVTSYTNHCVYVYDSSGRQKTTIGSNGNGPLQFSNPTGIVINGELMFVANCEADYVRVLNINGTVRIGSCTSGPNQSSCQPQAVCIGPDRKIYVARSGKQQIEVFHPNRMWSHNIQTYCVTPYGLCFDISGNLHVSDRYSNCVIVFTPKGQQIHRYGRNILNQPRGIVIDPAGYSLVINDDGHSLFIFDPRGNFLTSTAIGLIKYAVGITVSPDGSIWIADNGNNQLLKF